MTEFFRDNFTGVGDLSTHLPDTGAGYTQEGGGLLSAMTLNGSGKLRFNAGTGSQGSYAGSLVTVPAGDYAIECQGTFTAIGVVAGLDEVEWIDLILANTADSAYLVEMWLDYSSNFVIWTLNVRVYLNSGATLFADSTTVTITAGVPFTMKAEVVGANTNFYLDGVLKFTTANIPDVQPGMVVFSTHLLGADTPSTTQGALDYVVGTGASAPGSFWTDFVKTVETVV